MTDIKHLWLSPLNNCNLCNKPFGGGEGESSVMADAALGGPWGNFCDDCIEEHTATGAMKFGLGLGQKYELQQIGTDAEGEPQLGWVKVEG